MAGRFLLVAVLAPLLALGFAAPGDDPARIEVERDGDTLLMRGIFEAADPPGAELNYTLDVRKQGASGTSSTRQGGAFTPTPGRADTLSTVRLGVQPGDTVEARLDVTGPAGFYVEVDFRETIR